MHIDRTVIVILIRISGYLVAQELSHNYRSKLAFRQHFSAIYVNDIWIIDLARLRISNID